MIDLCVEEGEREVFGVRSLVVKSSTPRLSEAERQWDNRKASDWLHYLNCSTGKTRESGNSKLFSKAEKFEDERPLA